MLVGLCLVQCREQVQNGKLRVTHVSSKDQLADGLTKPLSRTRFGTLFTKIGITNHAKVRLTIWDEQDTNYINRIGQKI